MLNKHAYKMRKGYYDVPQKITVLEESGEKVKYVWGWHEFDSMEDAKEKCWTIMQCTKCKVIYEISEIQKIKLKAQEDIFEREREKLDREVRNFKAKVRGEA